MSDAPGAVARTPNGRSPPSCSPQTRRFIVDSEASDYLGRFIRECDDLRRIGRSLGRDSAAP